LSSSFWLLMLSGFGVAVADSCTAYPQLGQSVALSDISLLHSGQLISAIKPLHYAVKAATGLTWSWYFVVIEQTAASFTL